MKKYKNKVKIENLSMRINDLESQIAFKMQPILQNQQKIIEFYKTRAFQFTFHTDTRNSVNNNKTITGKNEPHNSKHIRTISLNMSKQNEEHLSCKNQRIIQKNNEQLENSYCNQEKMGNFLNILKNVVSNLNNDLNSYVKTDIHKKKENSVDKEGVKALNRKKR